MTGTDMKDHGIWGYLLHIYGSYCFCLAVPDNSGHLEFQQDEGHLDNNRRNKMGIKIMPS